MKIRILPLLIAAAVFMPLMSGCGKNAPDNSEEIMSYKSEAVSEAQETAGTGSDPELSKFTQTVKSSLVSTGNTYRLQKKLKDISEGKETVIAFLGGSITEGYTVKPEECWAYLTYDWLKGHYPEAKLEYVNAGLSGTPSILGNLRVKRDVLDKKADIVFIEYAVNDGGDKLYQESYDSLVRTVLSQENEPAVILLFNRTKEGHTSQEYMKQIGEYYDLPMISTADALTPGLEDGSLVWEDYYNDSSHPSPEGHKFFLECIKFFFFSVLVQDTLQTGYEIKSPAKFGAPYENAVMIEADYDGSIEGISITDTGSFDLPAAGVNGFRKGWKYNKDSDGSPFKFTVTGNALFLVCTRNNSGSMGKIEIYIDGKKAKTIDTNDKDGWGDPYAYQVIKWQSVKEMNVEIKIAEGSENKTAEILAIGFSAVNTN